MSKKTGYWFILLTMCLTLACKKALYIPAASDVDISNFSINEIDFEVLSTKTKFQFIDKGNTVSATANIRIRKDSIIWFVLTPALGIEAARGIITKDSMVVVDRINKTYSIFTFRQLSETFRFKMDYHLLESLILGNSTSNIGADNKLRKEGDFMRLLQEEGPLSIDNHINMATKKIEKVDVKDALTNNSMVIVYTNFQPLAEFLFANQTLISLNYRAKEGGDLLTTQINLEHNKADIETKKVKFPFNIPAKYELK